MAQKDRSIKGSDMLNWSKLSKRLVGSETAIHRNKIPKKWERKMKRLLKFLDKWAEWAETVD